MNKIAEYPLFETNDLEKVILRELELHLIYYPYENPFKSLEMMSRKVYCPKDTNYNVYRKLMLALDTVTLMNAFKYNSIFARIYITQLLNKEIV